MTDNPTQRFYDRISHAYDMIADGGEHVAREKGLEMLAVQAGESVLEIGYGTGHSIVALARAVGHQGTVSGIDISPGMREVAMKRVEQAGCAERVELVAQPAPPLPYADHSFDVVTMSFTLELFPLDVIPKVLAECKRVLKPGGRMGVVSMAAVEDGDRESVLERTYIWMHTYFPHIVDCQPIALESILKDAGFELVQHERMELFTMPVAMVVASLA